MSSVPAPDATELDRPWYVTAFDRLWLQLHLHLNCDHTLRSCSSQSVPLLQLSLPAILEQPWPLNLAEWELQMWHREGMLELPHWHDPAWH